MKFGIRELLFVLLLMGIPAGAYYWVFQPANLHIQKQQALVQEKTQKLAKLQKALVGIKNLNEEVEKLKNAVSFFEDKLPPQHEIHKVLDQVTRIAEEHRLDTKLFQTLKTQPCTAYSEQPIQMEVGGNFDSFYQFLLNIEKMPRITRITNMVLEKNKDMQSKMSAKFTLSIFFDQSEKRNTQKI